MFKLIFRNATEVNKWPARIKQKIILAKIASQRCTLQIADCIKLSRFLSGSRVQISGRGFFWSGLDTINVTIRHIVNEKFVYQLRQQDKRCVSISL